VGGTIHNAERHWTYNTKVSLYVIDCGVCGITFGLPERLNDHALAHPANAPGTVYFYCPAGHQLRYNGESREQELERSLEASRNRAARLTADLDQTEASRKAQKAAATRARNERDRILQRIKGGVCPCCNRSFKNVRRHMASQHPDYAIPEGEH
jgi:hypothetical protein